jgi:enamine deaminase RidA (YjgF/YER057c/UK114 family)
MSVEENLSNLNVTIGEVARPLASYAPAVRTGNLVYVSGQLPLEAGRLVFKGHVGQDIAIDRAALAARLCAINALAALKSEIGDLERVKRIVRVNGYISCVPEFIEHPKVLNGASDFLVEVFGERGKHSRIAIGVSSLPLEAPIEIDLIVEVE